MASSSEPSCLAIDATAGNLVWIRRRNGSWWPGRIMDLDELPEACLVPPKAGTPVKLLGKEDASIDWYNLEKSRRVKAFHCGEFDECIERVKDYSAPANRKNVKYARRDDAILHALELESSCKYSILKYGDATQCQSQSTVSCEHSDRTDALKDELFLSRKRHQTPNDSEDDDGDDEDEDEGTKRMRGLQDLGLSVVPKQSPETGGSLHLVLADNSSPSESDICNSMSSCSPNSTRTPFSPARRKVLKLSIYLHESGKRKCRRRPLTKVLEISSKAAVPSFCEQGLTEIKVSGFGSLESDKTNSSVVINNNSDTSGTSFEKEATSLNACEPLESAVGDSQNPDCTDLQEKVGCCEDLIMSTSTVGGGNQRDAFEIYFNAVGRQSFQHIQVESVALNDEGLDDKSSTSFSIHPCLAKDTEKGCAKRQLGDKKNLKGMSRSSNEISSPLIVADRINPSDEFNMFDHSSFDSLCVSDSCRQLGGGSQRLFHHDIGGGNLSSDVLAVHPKSEEGQFFQRQSQPADHYPVYPNCLYDVHIDGQAKYRSKHAPLVSVVSKLNSRAIVGHQIAVQILEDGHCWKTYGCFISHKYELTNYEKERSGSQLRHSRKNGIRSFMQLSAGSKKKLAKLRKCGFLSKKMRNISSISFGTGHKEKARNTVVDKLSSPDIACVPLNVVFSRISKALNSSSRSPAFLCEWTGKLTTV